MLVKRGGVALYKGIEFCTKYSVLNWGVALYKRLYTRSCDSTVLTIVDVAVLVLVVPSPVRLGQWTQLGSGSLSFSSVFSLGVRGVTSAGTGRGRHQHPLVAGAATKLNFWTGALRGVTCKNGKFSSFTCVHSKNN